MAILTFILGALLFAAGFGALAWSVDLVPTEMGRLYALSGVIFLSASGVVWALAAVIARLNRIFAGQREVETALPAAEAVAAPQRELAPPPEEDVNLNRRGRLPTLRAVENAIAEPEAAPQVIGRYSAGGAKYVVFSDGAIEAETADGGLRFSSMEEFKAYIADRKR